MLVGAIVEVVFDHTDDAIFGAQQLHLPANGFLRGTEGIHGNALREHCRYRPHALLVALPRRPRHDLDIQQIEVVGVHRVHLEEHRKRDARERRPIVPTATPAADQLEWHRGPIRRSLNARRLGERCPYALHAPDPFVAGLDAHRRKRQRPDVLRAEPELLIVKPGEAAQEQARPGYQNDRQRDFRDDQSRTHAAGPASLRAPPCSTPQVSGRIRLRKPEGW